MEAERPSGSQLVVVGASAGGIEALSALVSSLEPGFPAPVVIAQHLDPSRPSHLESILSSRTELPVKTVSDREQLQPGVIFVVPANRHVEIGDHEVQVREADSNGPKPSVDWLLQTASERYGEGLIAVILTGAGSDGAAGAGFVKEHGGTVVIQNPETARYPMMPQSLAPTNVDIIANLENVGSVLYELLSEAPERVQVTDDQVLRAFLERVRERSGIDFSTYKMPTILRRLQRRMVAVGASRLSEYSRYLQTHPDEHTRLVNSFLVNVTEFFRDPELFEYLRTQVLPELVRAARESDKDLRIWTAGCSTGEEAYSLAILLCEILGDELDQLNIRIFATDIDGEAIEFARRGVYPVSALRNVSDDLVARYFLARNEDFEISKQVRSLIIFGQHDLGQRAPFPRTDLAVCRNVLIYFTPELQRRALHIFAFSLRDQGYMVLGKAETTSPLANLFVVENSALRVYRRQGERVPIVPAQFGPPPYEHRPGPARGAPLEELIRVQRDTQRLRLVGQRSEDLLASLPLGLVVVDRHYDVVFINGAARALLGVHSSAIGEDVVHMTRNVPPEQVRDMIDRAFETGAPQMTDEVLIFDTPSGEERYVQLTCQLVEGRTDTAPEGLAVLSIVEVTRQAQARRSVETARDQSSLEADQLRAQVERLLQANQDVLRANQELASENTALRNANEEFLVGSEEMGAATEEVETLNEELQATNEELETLNEELQATVEELNTTNEDLESRSFELSQVAAEREEQRRASEDERKQLAAILAGIGDAVLVVSPDGSRLLTNHAYASMFGSTRADFTPEDPQGALMAAEDTPQARAARGEHFDIQFTMGQPDGSRRWFEASGHPLGSPDDPEGGVLVIRDITDRSLRQLQEEFFALAIHELRTPLTAVQAYLSLLQRQIDTGAAGRPEVGRFVAEALVGIRRLADQISELRDLGSVEAGVFRLKFEPVELGPTVARAIEVGRTIAGEKSIRVAADEAVLRASGDPARLEQVLLNLLLNAVNYAPDSEYIDVRLRQTGKQAVIEIQDYGPGIPESDLPYLFERFYRISSPDRPHRPGLGLGLYIAREIITGHGGKIKAKSDLGHGTTFIIHLPLLLEG